MPENLGRKGFPAQNFPRVFQRTFERLYPVLKCELPPNSTLILAAVSAEPEAQLLPGGLLRWRKENTSEREAFGAQVPLTVVLGLATPSLLPSPGPFFTAFILQGTWQISQSIVFLFGREALSFKK